MATGAYLANEASAHSYMSGTPRCGFGIDGVRRCARKQDLGSATKALSNGRATDTIRILVCRVYRNLWAVPTTSNNINSLATEK